MLLSLLPEQIFQIRSIAPPDYWECPLPAKIAVEELARVCHAQRHQLAECVPHKPTAKAAGISISSLYYL